MLTLYRRHKKSCEHCAAGRDHKNCRCPIWVRGSYKGISVARSLKSEGIENMEAADDWADRWKRSVLNNAPMESRQPKRINEACEEFLAEARNHNLRESTLYKYGTLLKQLCAFADRGGYRFLAELTATPLRQFRSEWKNNPLSASKKLQILRLFLNFAEDEEWISANPARKLKPPKVDSSEVVPFTYEEMAAVLKACDTLAAQASGRLNAVRLAALYSYFVTRGFGSGTLLVSA
jgi:hypothetical protein